MVQETILVADDDEMIVDALRYQLQREGYRVITAYDGETALETARRQRPDLILLDVMMPKLQGWEVCRALRTESTVPILMLTARGEEIDRVLGLELGADDYVVKPFSFRELLARIHANLRRAAFASFHPASTPTPTTDDRTKLGALMIDTARHNVTRDGERIDLTNREYSLLIALLHAHGAVFKRGDLLDQVWGEEWIGDPRTLDVHIRWLREKLEVDPSEPRYILTVRGVGYRLVAPDELSSDPANA